MVKLQQDRGIMLEAACIEQASGVKDRLGVELVGRGVTKSRVHVHSIVFASVSTFLTTLLSEVEESLVTILLPGASQVELEALVQLVYTGRCLVGGESGRRKLCELATSLGISRTALVEEEGSDDTVNAQVEEEKKKEEVLDNSTLTIDGGLGQQGIVSPSGTQENHIESSSRKNFSKEEYDLVEPNRYRLLEFQGRKHLIDNVISNNNCKRSKKKESVLKKNSKEFSEATHDLSLYDVNDGFTSIRYACHICSKSLSRKNDLKRHVMLHTGERKFSCSFCATRFVSKGDLNKHVRSHTGEKPYQCDFPRCSKSFSLKGDLNKHRRIHSEDKRFKCEQCQYRCIQSTDLKNHMLIHMNSKPFFCRVCPKTFRKKNQLKEHLKRQHSQESIGAP